MSSVSVDPSVWAELVKLQEETSPDFIRDLVATFLAEVPLGIQKMKQAISKESALDLWSQAHKLKGSSAYLGALGMRDLCVGLESLGHTGKVFGARERVQQLEAEFEIVKKELQARADSMS